MAWIRLSIVCFAAMVIASAHSQGAGFGLAQVSSSPMMTFADMQPVEGGDARLYRSRDWIVAEIATEGLEANVPYTVWWVIFNNPGGCSPDPDGDPGQPICDFDDAVDPDGNPSPNPLARLSVLWASGNVANADGSATFAAVLRSGEPAGELVFGPGLEPGNGQNAEVHLVVRGHGPIDEERLVAQLNTFEGECETCQDEQFAIFVPIR